MPLLWIFTALLCGIAAARSAPAPHVSSAALVHVENWRTAAGSAWTFADSKAPGHKGRVTFPGGVLRLEDNADGAATGPEARWTHTAPLGKRFAVEFRARLLRTGLADESTGDASLLRITIGDHEAGRDFGVAVTVNGDRYNVDASYKVVRTDDRWHDWRLEADAQRSTLAMFRDGEYVCLHSAGAPEPAGVRIQVKGSAQTPAIVEIAGFKILPLGEVPAPTVARTRPKSALGAGEWPLWRRDVRNTAVSPMKGHIRAPRVAWSVPVGGDAATPEFLDLDGDGRAEALISRGGKLTAQRLDGSVMWQQRLDNATVYGLFDLAGDGEKELVVGAGTPSQLQVLRARDGTVRYISPQYPKSGVAGIRIAKIDPKKRGLQAVVWSHFHELGYCLSFTQGVEHAHVDWTFDWKQSFFTPLTALADMDRDGVLDLIVATYNHVFVFDGRTGAKKMEREYHSGRNYGTLVVKDIDGDGYPDVVVLADVLREHVDVLKNEGGKSLRLLWTKFYEQNYPSDHVSLRVLTESVADFDGDGKTEIVYGAFDDRTDGRWHTLVVDAVTGHVRADLIDRYPVGAGPLFPGRPPALLVSKPSNRTALNLDHLAVWAADAGKWREHAALPQGTLLSPTSVRDFRIETWAQVSGIATGTPSAWLRSLPAGKGRPGFCLLLPDKSVRWVVGNRAGGVETAWQAALPPGLPGGSVQEVAQLRPDAAGPQRVIAGSDGVCRVIGARGETIAKLGSRGGVIVQPVVARLKRGEQPSLLFIDPKGVLQCYRATAKGGKLARVWSRPAQGCWSYYLPNSRPNGVPVIADVIGSGDKAVLVAQKPDRLVALGSDGSVVKSWKFPSLPQQWSVGSFDGDAIPDLLVTYPVGPILNVATVAVAGKDGRTLWRVLAGNGPTALADMDGDGRDDVITRDLYERRTLNGRDGRDILPITMQQGYQTPVVLGSGARHPYSGAFWLGGSWAAHAEDAAGKLLWLHWLSPTGTACVADVSGDGKQSVGAVTAGEIYELPNLHPVEGPDREFLCYDAETGGVEWSMPLGTTSAGVVAADVDGDGKPEFVLGTADGRLMALRGGADAGERVLWKITLPAALGAPIVCDVDGSGRMAILICCADGRLYCVK